MTGTLLRRRHSGHMSASRGGSDQPFHRALRKYGMEMFSLVVLHEGIQSLSEAEDLEQRCISRENTFGFGGYNATKGGASTTGRCGELHSRNKLTEGEALNIISDSRPHSVVSGIYGVSSNTVQGIRDGTSWSHLDRSSAPEYQKYVRISDETTAISIIESPLGHAEVARKYSVPLSYVHNIRHGRSWKNLNRSNAPKYENKR